MKLKIQILSIVGGLLFEYEKKDNTQRETILEAIRVGANLSSADLSSANLRSADLSSANLSYANLSYADLSYANLLSANLSSANLSYANLRSANLSSANLRSADLSSANLSSANLSSAVIPINCKWSVSLKNDKIIIGCKEDTIEGWDKFFDGIDEYSTKRGSKEFAKIQAMYESNKAYILFMKAFEDNKTSV